MLISDPWHMLCPEPTQRHICTDVKMALTSVVADRLLSRSGALPAAAETAFPLATLTLPSM